MRWWILLMGLMTGLSVAAVSPKPANQSPVNPERWLMSQIKLGESRHNDVLVKASIGRLLGMDPDNAQALAAQVRLALRQHSPKEAKTALTRLEKVAPESRELAMARRYYALFTSSEKQQLQRARMWAYHYPRQALEIYQRLFAEGIPSPELALEYWEQVARVPGGRPKALKGLKKLVAAYPGGKDYRLALITLRLDINPANKQAFRDMMALSADEDIGEQAMMELTDYLLSLPVAEQSVAKLQQYLDAFPHGERFEQVGRELDRQRRLLADPAFQGKRAGLAWLDKPSSDANTQEAERHLAIALAGRPHDADVIGGMGIVRMRQGRHREALTLFRKAKKLNTDPTLTGKWDGLITTAGYWAHLSAGDQALEQGNWSEAKHQFEQAKTLNPAEPYAWNGLGQLHSELNAWQQAEQDFKEALVREADNETALRALARLYVDQGRLDEAKQLTRTLREPLRDTIEKVWQHRRAERLQQQAEQAIAEENWDRAVDLLDQAVALQPEAPWLRYDLAKARQARGDQADTVAATFLPLLETSADSPELRYAYALVLSSLDRTEAALGVLQGKARSEWTEKMRQLAKRLEAEGVLRQARQRWQAGKQVAAQNLLSEWQQHHPHQTAISLQLAEWAAAAGHWQQAEEQYQRVLAQEPDQIAAKLGLLEGLQASGQHQRLRDELTATSWAQGVDDLKVRSRVAALWADLGELSRAQRILEPMLRTNGDDPLLYRDMASLARRQGDVGAARQYYQHAMMAAGLGLASTDRQFTRLTRPGEDDDWLVRSIRADSSELYRQRNSHATLAYDVTDIQGTGGVSQLQTATTMLEIDWPTRDGRAFFRTDQVELDAGEIDLSNPAAAAELGSALLCAPSCPFGDTHQQDSGISLAVGWQGEHWRWDIGTTPLGFALTDWSGGLEYQDEWGDWDWSAGVSRRPLDSSLLAFAGTTDPTTGLTWGGVRATGMSLGIVRDKGESLGLWGSLRYHRLSGEHVADNERFWLMGGLYRRLINEPDRQFRVGTNAMLWHFDNDQSEYTLGQGGYYSPQSYVSVSLPLVYRQRRYDWSWELEGAISLSVSDSDGSIYYPGFPSLQATANDPRTDGGGGTGLGWSGRARVEYRVTPHWFVGASLGMQQGEDYTSGNGQLYVRYHLHPWDGLMDFPPEPLQPYARFR